METSTAYQSYLSAMQNYQTPQGRKDYQVPYASQFEASFSKAKEQDVVVPTTMPADVRDAYISTMNSLSDKEKMLAMSLILDPAHLNAQLKNEPYAPTTIDYHFLEEQVESRLNPENGGFTSEETKAATLAFWNAFNASFKGDKTNDDVEEAATDSSVAQFLKDLHTKGATQFLADLNQEKIDKLVQEYQKKLLDSMGDSPEALKEIEKLLEDFKTKLIEEMNKKMEDEAKNKKKNIIPISRDSFVQELIDLEQKRTNKPLEELLQS